MSLIATSMKSLSKFKIIDVQIFKFYLLFVGLLLAKLVPWVLALNVWWYVIVSVLAIVYFLTILFKKWEKKVWFVKLWLSRFHKFNMLQISIYKVTTIVFALMLVKLFPCLLDVNIAWYAAGFAFGAGYFVKTIWVK